MDESAPRLDLDEEGVCGYCREYDEYAPQFHFTDAEMEANMDALQRRIKSRKTGEYDVLIGLSGGVDSSYLALMTHRLGLKALAIHFDNGWNSRQAVSNIRKIIDKTGFDFETYVINWPEFRDLQRAYFKAGVVDIEALTDHAITAAMYHLRKKYNIATILGGSNFATEHGMPPEWGWHKQDWRNIKAIHRRYGEKNLKTFPHFSTLLFGFSHTFGLGGHFEYPLNLINYRKNHAMKELQDEFDWEYYGGKHYESTFTKFYQAYILPIKFGIDKRTCHLSALIRNGEIDRDQALDELAKPNYDSEELRRDKRFVAKKLGFTETEFDDLMAAPPRAHDDFPTDRSYMDIIHNLWNMAYGMASNTIKLFRRSKAA